MRNTRTAWRVAACLVVLNCATSVFADGWTSSNADRQVSKRGSASGQPTAETAGQEGVAMPKGNQLVPFPEDLVQTKKPTSVEPRKSDFRPRFKPPTVRQAQHVEPVDEGSDEDKSTDGPKLLPVPNEAEENQDESAEQPVTNTSSLKAHGAHTATGSAGQGLVDEAFVKSKAATDEKDFSEVIDLCRRGMGLGLAKKYDEYARRLLGWSYNRRGETRAKEGRDAEALADFEAAVEASGTWRAIHNRGVSYAAQGRVQPAMADFNRTIQLNDKYPNAYFNRGELKYKQGDFAGALSDYTAAINLNPKDSASLNSRGYALYRMERFGEALRDYGEAIKIDPDNVSALINRADTYADMGQYSEAAKDYRAAIRIAPKLGRAYHSAAWFMATCPDQHYRNDKLAIDAARRAIEIDGEDYRNLSTLAAAQASGGFFDEACATQEKAIKIARQNDLVTAEKMMSLYRREIAFRERPRTAFKPPEDLDVDETQQASGSGSKRELPGRYPTRQASGTLPTRTMGRPTARSRY